MSAQAKFIHSQIKELSTLYLNPFPSRPFKVAKAMRVGRVFVAVGENGRIYTSQANDCPGFWSSVNRMAPTIEALISFGLLSPEAIKQHKAAEAAESAAKQKRWAASHVLESYEAAGLKLTASQLSKLQAAAEVKAAA